jgi:hypothetical protein
MIGNLKKTEQGWVIQYRMDFDLIATDGGTIPVHPDHGFWLKMWGEENMEMNFELQDEFAVLKANGPDTHEYTQD